MNDINVMLKNALDFPGDERTIYKIITFQSTPNSELNKYIGRYTDIYKEGYVDRDNAFSRWINRFSPESNINVFVQDDWRFFCRFVSKNHYGLNYKDEFKLYLSIDSEHIEKAVNDLFAFMSRNNIKHDSKVGRAFRVDNVVLRVEKREDVDKITEFVKNNSYIQAGLKEPSVFAYSKDKIGYAMDGSLSYNNILSKYIASYSLLRRNEPNRVNVNDFSGYLKEEYEKLINGGFNPNEKCQKEKLEIYYGNSTKYLELCHYILITKLIISALNPNRKMEDYYEHHDVFNDPKLIKEMSSRLSNGLSIKDLVTIKKVHSEENTNKNIVDESNKVNISNVSEEEIFNILSNIMGNPEKEDVVEPKKEETIIEEIDKGKETIIEETKKNIDEIDDIISQILGTKKEEKQEEIKEKVIEPVKETPHELTDEEIIKNILNNEEEETTRKAHTENIVEESIEKSPVDLDNKDEDAKENVEEIVPIVEKLNDKKEEKQEKQEEVNEEKEITALECFDEIINEIETVKNRSKNQFLKGKTELIKMNERGCSKQEFEDYKKEVQLYADTYNSLNKQEKIFMNHRSSINVKELSIGAYLNFVNDYIRNLNVSKNNSKDSLIELKKQTLLVNEYSFVKQYMETYLETLEQQNDRSR